jgi:LuxR family transcriptional regulator, maltose regulon positive regulatory protein
MQNAEILIQTKLHLPFTKKGLVLRPRLRESVLEGLSKPLTLVAAPAGFGKTTLVASCVAGSEKVVAWLSLDKDDNQAGRFLNYLIAALQNTDHTMGIEAAKLMKAAQQVPAEAILTSLINELDIAQKETVLVLDDYQFISNLAVHEQVIFLLEHCPQTLHLIIATRSDPPLPLARLRARGQMVELRAADLRFTEPEAVQFMNSVMGLHLDAGAVAVLEERTEGWIAGLQMAALSIRDREDVGDFIEEFSGTNRYILDYLLEEVLSSQSPETQCFLLYTSILDRLNARLCDAVLAGDETSKKKNEDRSTHSESLISSKSASILEYLERVNLFLVPLDDERNWYRYHHLFSDLLHTRLQQTLNPKEIAVLHSRAARWYEQNGLTYDAIQHASLAADDEWVERLIEQNYMEIFQRRDSASVRFWTGSLAREMIFKRPRLCIHTALKRSWLGDLDEAELFLNEAEKRIQEMPATAETQVMLGNLAYVRSRVTAMRGNIRGAIKLALTAREKTPTSNQALLGGIGVMLGYAYFLDGDFSNSSQILSETIKVGKSVNAVNTTMGAYGVLGRLYALQGQLHKSFELYQEAEKFIQDVDSGLKGVMGIVKLGIADLLYAWNDLESAHTYIKQGLEFLPLWNKPDDMALAYITLSRMELVHGNLASAVETIEKGSQVVHTSGVFSEARDTVETAEIKLLLKQGKNLAVDRWAHSLENSIESGNPLRFENELAHITLARVFLARKKWNESIGLLSRLETNARSGGRMGRLIEILILEALAQQKLNKPAQALENLAKSLALAEPEGYIRVYMDEGEPMRLLLAQWLAHADNNTLRDYVIRLLSYYDAEVKKVTVTQEKASQAKNLVEPLSQRELEVLHIIALGKTNQEIAKQLIVSPGTIKAHTASIYRKLDVSNRTEAVSRARQLGIIP